MKRLICSLSISLLLAVGIVSAQQPTPAVIDSSTTAVDSKKEVYVKDNIPFKKPIPFAPVREADVLYEKTVWRMLDLRQKQNLPLYYPALPTRKIGGRVNLFTLLLEGLERGEITAYNAFPQSDEFATNMIQTFEEVIGNSMLKSEDRQETTQSIYTGRDTMITIPGRNVLQDEDVSRFILKEKYYFDRRHSKLERRVVGICPIFSYMETVEGGEPTRKTIPVMWVYFDEARPLLARHFVFNDFNDAQNVSYDDFFMQHFYVGVIQKTTNVYNNRYISDYAKGVDALFEAARIEDEIFNIEQDMWEY
jgi:gliding motility associated protien GldN